MKPALSAVIGLLFLVSCSSEKPAAPEPVATAPAATPIPCPPTVSGYRFLPEQLEVPVDYHIRVDRLYTSLNDQPRRRIALEFLEGDADSVLASVEQAMLKAGYEARPRRIQPNDNIIAPFVKKGGTSLTVMLNPNAGDKPSNPEAKGVLIYDYPLGPAHQKAATQTPPALPEAG